MTRGRGRRCSVAMAIGFGAWGGAAQAGQAFMHTGGRTTQPIGHYDFCQREPDECRQKTAEADARRTDAETLGRDGRHQQCRQRMVTPRTDMEMWGKEEIWSYPTNVGDCEDYALEKRRRLMALGVPAGDLLMTVVRQPNGDGHAVLTVRTSRGDFILDNLEPRVLAWTETEYTYLKRQSERNSGAWVAVDDSREAVAVGSVK